MSPYDAIPKDPLKVANERAHTEVKKMVDSPASPPAAGLPRRGRWDNEDDLCARCCGGA